MTDGITSQEFERRMEEVTTRLEKIRAEDKDIRHERNKAQDAAMLSLQAKVLEIESACQENEVTQTLTKKSVDRLVNVLQGDPEMDSDGFIKRSTASLKAISDKISELETDKSESRTHRQQHADIPGRVTVVEKRLDVQDTRIKTVGWVATVVIPAIAAAIIWLRDVMRGHQ